MGQPMDRSNRWLAPETSFEGAFSALEAILIESYEEGKGTSHKFGRPRGMKEPGFNPPRRLMGGLARCSNPDCRRGGYEIDRDAHDMVYRGLVTKEFVRWCPGDEGSPKGRRVGYKCSNRLYYRLTLKYKSEHAPIRVTLSAHLSRMTLSECPICPTLLLKDPQRGVDFVSCGTHAFKRAGKNKLELVERPDSATHHNPGAIYALQRKVDIQYLKLTKLQAHALLAGTLSADIKSRVDACLRGGVQILFGSGTELQCINRDEDSYVARRVKPLDLIT